MPDVSEDAPLNHELDYAKAMAAGTVQSPHRYENVWLFDIRITGSGIAYRAGLEEYALRPEEIFLTDEFLQRCNGLPVIFEHPVADPEKGKTNLLDSDEFADRIIGTVFYPYRKGDEVWAIAKIYDDDGAAAMQSTHLSTSPGINFGKKGSLKSLVLSTGDKLVIEGDPSMIDHICVCELGVWDKGGPPQGINIGDHVMPDEMKTEAKMDEAPAWAKGIADSVAALSSRVDAMCAKADSETEKEAVKKAEDAGKEEAKEEKVAEAKADAEDEKDEKKDDKADAAKADMETAYADMQRQITRLTAQLPRDWTDEDRNAIAAAKSRADSAYGALGKDAPHALMGEGVPSYRRRLASGLQSVSKAWKGIALKDLPEAAFDNVEIAIYTDAAAYARTPADVARGQLREVKSTSPAGHRISTYVGDPSAWMDQFAPPVRLRARITKNAGGQQ